MSAPSSSPTNVSATPTPPPAADYGPSPVVERGPVSPSSEGKRFLYFAYGSNLLPSILLLKEVKVHSARPGFIDGVKMLFDLKVDSLVEPCYANLQRKVGERVHGVVYELDERDMLTMDRVEGNGRSYVREEFEVNLYHTGEDEQHTDNTEHKKVIASAYICHPNNLSQLVLCDHPPSERYLEVLVNGAKHHGLDATYINWLEKHPATPLPQLKFSPEQTAAVESKEITEADMAAHAWKSYMDEKPDWKDWNDPLYVSLKGVVFDLRPSKWSSAFKKHNAGKDLTLFCAGRVATDVHSIPKTLSELGLRHKAYIDATLVDYASIYPIMGHTADRAKYDW